MAEANISSRRTARIEILRRHATRCIVEINEQVSAENDVEQTVRPCFGALDDIGRREAHRLTWLVDDLPMLRAGGREIFVGQRPAQAHERAPAENASTRGFQNTGVDIRANDLD